MEGVLEGDGSLKWPRDDKRNTINGNVWAMGPGEAVALGYPEEEGRPFLETCGRGSGKAECLGWLREMDNKPMLAPYMAMGIPGEVVGA